MARFIRCLLLTGLAITVLSAGTAQAQSLFWGPYRSWPGDYTFRHKHKQGPTKSESTKKPQVQESSKGPLLIVISIADQRISLYDNGALIARSSVSTGVRDHPTPLGVFSVISKSRWHTSNIYSNAPMPYMQRITWSGIALHAGVLPGHPASHGCIRLTNDFAIRLWHLTKRGTRVVIARDEVQPVEVSNARLFAAKTKTVPAAPEAATKNPGNDAIVAVATPAPLSSNAKATEDGKASDAAPAAVAPKKPAPISIFVSRKLSKLFVRQGFNPLFDAPVEIQNQPEPTGTHVFTAMDLQNDGASMRWTVVSVPETPSPDRTTSRKSHKGVAKPVKAAQATPDKANAALNRIAIPQDTVDRISELLTPGSSLIISDYGISGETGQDTDFIVLTR